MAISGRSGLASRTDGGKFCHIRSESRHLKIAFKSSSRSSGEGFRCVCSLRASKTEKLRESLGSPTSHIPVARSLLAIRVEQPLSLPAWQLASCDNT